MAVRFARGIGSGHIDVAYERFGDETSPPVVMVMGLSSQMIHWPDAFCEELARQQLHVIRFDNRDAGLSTHVTDGPLPDFQAAMSGDLSSASYTLSDMASDTVGLLDWLAIDSAHVVGASMGGYIAQMIAIEHSQRVRTLTCLMSNTGDPSVGQPSGEVMQLLSLPSPKTREEAIERAVSAARIVGSPGFDFDEDATRARATLAYDRSYDPHGIARQAIACIASGDRTSRLRSLRVPTLAIHGADDKMCDVSGGKAIADAIEGSRLIVIEGMGHSLPRALWPQIASSIAEHVRAYESAVP